MPSGGGSKGFTLAEVLITLGIIGVVAAMTIPTLIANYKEKVYITGAKNYIIRHLMQLINTVQKMEQLGIIHLFGYQIRIMQMAH